MDFSKLIAALGDNAEAVAFVRLLHTEQTETKEKMQKLAREADEAKAEAKEVEKYKTEAKEAFEARDKIKEEIKALKDSGKEPDNELIEQNNSLKLKVESLTSQMTEAEKDRELSKILSGMDFRGEGEAKERIAGIYKNELAKNLKKHDEIGWVYVDEKGNPRRNPEDATTFLTPKTFNESKSMREFYTVLNGVSSNGDGFQGGGQGGSGGQPAPKSFKEKQAALMKNT